ncbi:MAG: hypothetical protein EOO59_09575 [Hymenobacter sp.]|nr:MAG: hypothetical protein EOO59_09575 [Hymenobacter sp.]
MGPVLRVPLRRAALVAGCAGHPARQLLRWLGRMATAYPAFPHQLRSVLLLASEPLCGSCHRALGCYLARYQPALRVRVSGAAPCECGCESQWRLASLTWPPSAGLGDELAGEAPRRPGQLQAKAPAALPTTLAAAARVPATDPGRLLTDRQLLALAPRAPVAGPIPATGPYRIVHGHHIHQSGAYAPKGPSAQHNPNHRAALAIEQNVPGFTRAQHNRASAVQRSANQAAHGRAVNQRAGTVRVTATGTGHLAQMRGAAPSQGFEDLKAYYALLAAGQHPAEAYRLVSQSARQLVAAGRQPVRVPTR